VRIAVFVVWVGATAAIFWMDEHRPYDLWWWSNPTTRSPEDFACYDIWTPGREVSGKIQRGEVVRVLVQKRTSEGRWMRVARRDGGGCWMDRYYWDEATAPGRTQ